MSLSMLSKPGPRIKRVRRRLVAVASAELVVVAGALQDGRASGRLLSPLLSPRAETAASGGREINHRPSWP
jgi:hypothetical protein